MSYDVWFEAELGGPSPVRVFDSLNYTSNVSEMWRDAMPPEGLKGFDGKTAAECRQVLVSGIAKMLDSPDRYRAMEPENGWGSFDGQLKFLIGILEHFDRAPHATVRVCS